jgi:hypothetical protein
MFGGTSRREADEARFEDPKEIQTTQCSKTVAENLPEMQSRAARPEKSLQLRSHIRRASHSTNWRERDLLIQLHF